MHARSLAVLALAAAFSTVAAAHDEPHPPAAGHDHSKTGQTALGRAADPARAARTIRIEMSDAYEFSPSTITIEAGEIVRFVAVNVGVDPHEMVLGTMDELREHAAAMKKDPGMRHDEANLVQVAPGSSGVMAWQFTRPGDFYFACLVDDHFDRGMVGRIHVVASAAGEPHAGHEHAAPEMPDMSGLLGPYAMTREGSGTSWLPDATPEQGIHGMLGEWMTMTHGFANLIYDKQGGPRGDTKTFSTSMLMLMGQRAAGDDGTLGARAMISADPLMGKTGYPLLLQTGESANGQPLIDRQHPHDLFMELALSYSRRLSETSAAFVYAGLPGEPALGPPAFMHRFSGEDNPEAPITHHWLDSTHITYGVVTLGYLQGGLKLEASAFRGREPDENRYDIETGKLDSASLRLSWNPARRWALQVSRGRIKSPEELHPDVDIDRTTASAIYQSGRTQTTFAWGRNAPNHGNATDAFLLESAARLTPSHTLFARAELVEKNELFLDDDPRAEDVFRVGKLTAGYVYDLPREGHFRIGLGGLVSRYSIPADLKPVYGNPTSFMLFARVRIQ
jgi:uncharacterized cupredoxin-like copper-binding protein